MASSKKTAATGSSKEEADFWAVLQARFEKNKPRHPRLDFARVRARLISKPGKWRSLMEMEGSGGEPDVVELDAKNNEIVFVDCSPESPTGRRSLCYDRLALTTRKEHKPNNSALDLAASMGVELLSEEQYVFLQKLGVFDATSSSWLLSPPEIRKRGGAIFGDRRFDRVFIYHNGADAYYAARGFRARLKV